jgi:hypothetical protein
MPYTVDTYSRSRALASRLLGPLWRLLLFLSTRHVMVKGTYVEP